MMDQFNPIESTPKLHKRIETKKIYVCERHFKAECFNVCKYKISILRSVCGNLHTRLCVVIDGTKNCW
jgi:hypothetical protein